VVEVERVLRESGCAYGSKRVHAELARQGVGVGCERTTREIMAERGWSSVHPTPWRRTTQPDGTPPSPDLTGQEFTSCSPGRQLVGDITQIDAWEGPVYLATVIDLSNREVIGYAIADHHRASLVCDAVNTARFRKVLGWKTPAEAFNQHLRSNQQIGVATTH